MRKFLVAIFLLLALFPSVHSTLEAWEHSHHSHAAACEEEGAHMHPKEVHCQLDHFAFLSTPWEPHFFQCAPIFSQLKRPNRPMNRLPRFNGLERQTHAVPLAGTYS